jgi:16S rRNA (adenine1518-N6/adenine1519-N6)-dimethyltransferase
MGRRLNVRQVLGRYGLKPKKTWSQNFLVDEDVLYDIAEAIEWGQVQTVVELGAGIGALCALMAGNARRVIAVERDRDLAALLRNEFSNDPVVEILEANAATLDFKEISARLGEKPAVVGNLPYHMATQILFHLLASGEDLSHWVLMFQKELADRLMAAPGGRDYGVVSVLVQQRTDVEQVLQVEPQAFYPRPRVRSSVLRFWPRAAPRAPVRDWELFERVVRGAFRQRRKKVRNALLASFGPRLKSGGLDRALSAAGIDGGRRAEQLSIEEFSNLADVLCGELEGNQ